MGPASFRPRPGRIWRAALTLMAGASWLLHGAAEEAASEYDVKAAFLLNFAKFTEWPASAFADSDAPIAICILGKDPFGRTIDELVQGEAANGRKLAVRRVDEPAAAQACQMVFVSGPGKIAAKSVSGLGKGVLTVGEGEGFVRDGGIIGFVVENRRVRFDINQTAAETAALKLSSKLLSVARAVEK